MVHVKRKVRPRDPQVWLGDDPGVRVHAGPSDAFALALPSTTQGNVRRRMPREYAQQHRRALEGSVADSAGRVHAGSARGRSRSP